MLFAAEAIANPHNDSYDDQRRAHDVEVPPWAFGIFLQQGAGNEYGNCADHQEPEQQPAVFIRPRAAIRKSKSVRDQLHPILEKKNEDSRQSSDVKRDVKAEARVREIQKLWNDSQVRCAADRQELGQTLDDAQHDRLIERHMMVSEIPFAVNFSLS